MKPRDLEELALTAWPAQQQWPYDGWVVRYRQQGYATALISQIVAWARQMGATDAALQVQGDNPAARALYARLGFQEVYHYWYRVSP